MVTVLKVLMATSIYNSSTYSPPSGSIIKYSLITEKKQFFQINLIPNIVLDITEQ